MKNLGHTFAFQKMRVFFQITKKHDFFFKTKSHMFNKNLTIVAQMDCMAV